MVMLMFIVSLLTSAVTSFWQQQPVSSADSLLFTTELIRTDQERPIVVSSDITLEDSFATQLSTITQDCENDFKNIKSIQDQEGSKGSRKRYYSLVLLDSAYESFIEVDTHTGQIVYEARYIGSTLAEYAMETYEVLKANVEYVQLSSCTLVEDKETINGNLRNQFYTAHLVKGQATPLTLDMVVEVALVQAPVAGSVGSESTVWVPVVRVYRK